MRRKITFLRRDAILVLGNIAGTRFAWKMDFGTRSVRTGTDVVPGVERRAGDSDNCGAPRGGWARRGVFLSPAVQNRVGPLRRRRGVVTEIAWIRFARVFCPPRKPFLAAFVPASTAPPDKTSTRRTPGPATSVTFRKVRLTM